MADDDRPACRMPLLAAAVLVVALVVSACGTSGQEEPDALAPPPDDVTTGLSGELRVFAAASLSDAFEELERRFEARHPAVDVLLNLAGSNRLAGQLLEGAQADVFASADEAQMEAVLEAGLASDPVVFAENQLAIVVEEGNPRDITRLSDLEREELVVVLPDPAVPAGGYASRVLRRAGLTVTPSSLALDVRAALSKVVLGEADAAIVYRSDLVSASGAVEGVPIPDEVDVTARYPIVVLSDTTQRETAEAFVAFVRGPQGRQVLRDTGFGTPE